MRGFDAVKEEIRQRVDLVEVVAEHVALTRAGGRFRGLCPFHREKTPSFHVIPDKMIFHCFGCKAGGDVFKFVQLRENVSFGEAVRILADRVGIELRARRADAGSGPGRSDLAKVNAWAAGYFRSRLLNERAGQAAREYLTHRGIADDTSERFGLGLACGGDAALAAAARLEGIEAPLLQAADLVRVNERGSSYDTFRDRLMFPIRDATQRTIGFGGRTLVEARAKYLNTAQNELFDKGRTLYGLDLARSGIAESGRAIVVEGYTDCIACHQSGFTEAVATLGTAMTEAHADLLRRYGQELILVFDSDEAGAAAAERALAVGLQRGLSVRLAFVAQGKDPADFLQAAGSAAFDALLNSAVDALRFTWERMRQRFDLETGDSGRHAAVRGFVELVSGLSRYGALDAIQQGLIANQVAALLNLPGSDVHRLFTQTGRSRRVTPAANGGVVSGQADPRREPSAEQAALTALLEVLLNEPGLLGLATEVFDPQRLADASVRQIGLVVLELADQFGEFSLVEVLDRLAEPEDARCATELALRGEQRGQLEQTLEGAVACLRRLASARQAASLGGELHRQMDGDQSPSPEPEGDPLEALSRVSREYGHFVPRCRLGVTPPAEL